MSVYSADGYLFTLGSSYPQANQQVRPCADLLHQLLRQMPRHKSSHATFLLVTFAWAEARLTDYITWKDVIKALSMACYFYIRACLWRHVLCHALARSASSQMLQHSGHQHMS